MSNAEILLVCMGALSIAVGAGAVVCVITDVVLKVMLQQRKARRSYRGKRRYRG